MSSRGIAYAALALGALLGLVAAGQRWTRVDDGHSTLLAVRGTTTLVNTDLTRILALVALIGAVLLLVLRPRGRRVLGLLLALLGLGMVLAAVLLTEPNAAQLAGRPTKVTADVIHPARWHMAYGTAGVLVLLGGLVTLVTARRWKTSAERFQPDSGSPVASTDEPVDLWRAQDAGLDPTADPEAPDVPKPPARETMNMAGHSERPSRRK